MLLLVIDVLKSRSLNASALVKVRHKNAVVHSAKPSKHQISLQRDNS